LAINKHLGREEKLGKKETSCKLDLNIAKKTLES
jgi:hypothetical protein